MSTVFLISAVLAQVAVVLLARAAGRRNIDPCQLLTLTGVIAGLATAGAAVVSLGPAAIGPALDGQALGVALFTAVVGAVGTLCYFEALKRGPAGPIATITGLQVFVPILFAVLLWDDRLSRVQIVGAALAGAAMFMVQSAPSGGVTSDGGRPWKLMTLGGMLLLGLTNTAFKYKEVHCPGTPTLLFLALYFGLASAVMGAVLLVRRQRIPGAALPFAAAMGLTVIVANGGTLLALKGLPATVVYLAVLAGSPVFVVLISIAFLGETYGRRVQGAIAAGLAGIGMMVGGK
jgi:drug/metabolite transporter (DMT)-like permease